jgi:hypothetical protein
MRLINREGNYAFCGYIDDVGHPFYPNQSCNGGGNQVVSCAWPATAQSNFLNVNNFNDWKLQSQGQYSSILQ